MQAQRWARYLDEYHRDRAGITESALDHAQDPSLGTAYDWLAGGLTSRIGRVLDCACGTMPMQAHLGPRAEAYVGIDLSLAEARAGQSLGRGPVVNATTTSLPFASGSFDTVVMSMALMLVPLAETLTEIRRVLTPGGQFGALVPALWPVNARDVPAGLTLTAILRGPGSMPRSLGPATARNELQRAGFTEVSTVRHRFPFRLDQHSDAELAVRSLYTPGRSQRQLRMAASALKRLPGWCQLPVPLMRVTALAPHR